jgi:c-di-GMP-binding flagellar brake protein YcgR
MSLETLPMPLNAMRGKSDALDEFRMQAPSEVQALLKQLQDSNVLLHLSTPDGVTYTTTLWALDAARGVICFSVDLNDPRVERLLESDEAVAVGYVDSIKVQFDVNDLVLVHNNRTAALNAAYPRELFRFQRRSSFRVRPLSGTRPVAIVPTPEASGGKMELRVMDVSLTGVALFLPDDAPSIEPGSTLDHVTLQLDGDTRLAVSLKLHHVTALHPDSKGARLGCELKGVGGENARALQRYIDQTQKRRRAMALD